MVDKCIRDVTSVTRFNNHMLGYRDDYYLMVPFYSGTHDFARTRIVEMQSEITKRHYCSSPKSSLYL